MTNVQQAARRGAATADASLVTIGDLTSGYSGTPLARKLGLKEGSDVALVSAPDGFERLLDPLPDAVRIRRRLQRDHDIVVCFTTKRSDLEGRFARLADATATDGGVWVAWPKRASGIPTDLTEHVVREIGLAHGLVDNKVCAIDETWSGLRFVRRLADR